MDILTKNCEACIPHYETTIRPDCKPYITSEIRRLIRHRDRLHKQYKINITDTSRNIYKQSRNIVVSKIRESLSAYHEKQMHSLNQDKCKNPKLFWNALKAVYSLALQMAFISAHVSGILERLSASVFVFPLLYLIEKSKLANLANHLHV